MRFVKWLLCLIVMVGLFSAVAYASEITEDETDVVTSESESEELDVVIPPEAVTALKAVGIGQNKVKIMWNASEGADGYLVYGIRAGSSYGYIGYTSNTSLIDNKAGTPGYNYYWVFPYVYNAEGKMIHGACPKYVYAQGVNPYKEVVTGVTALSNGAQGVALSWNRLTNVHGYAVYRKMDNGSLKYLGATTYPNFVDNNPVLEDYNYYWVYPYVKLYGETILGQTEKYAYCKAKLGSTNAMFLEEYEESIYLSWWSVNHADGYLIYRSTDGSSFKYLNKTTDIIFEDITPEIGVTYYYKVFPYIMKDGKMVSGSSSQVVSGMITKRLPVVPMMPSSLCTGDNGREGIYLFWVQSDDGLEEGYLLYRATEENGEYTLLAEIPNTNPHSDYQDWSATRKNDYYYKLYSFNKDGDNYLLSEPVCLKVGRKIAEPNFSTFVDCSHGRNTYNAYVLLTILNHGKLPLYVHTTGAYIESGGTKYSTLRMAANNGVVLGSTSLGIYYPYDKCAYEGITRMPFINAYSYTAGFFVPKDAILHFMIEYDGVTYECSVGCPTGDTVTNLPIYKEVK